MIHFYDVYGPLGLLSNYAACPLTFEGLRWPSAEHAYQASKFADARTRERIAAAPTAKEAARIGRDRSSPRRAEWSEALKLETMGRIQVAKFSQDAGARAVLLETGRARLVERNERCHYWGSGRDGLGANNFGRALEAAREVCAIGLVALECEGSLTNVAPGDVVARARLIAWLRTWPDDALGRLRHFDPMTGCPVGCSFCAQSAGPKVVALEPRALSNLVAALKLVGLEAAARHRLPDGGRYLDPASAQLVDGVFPRGFVMPAHGLVAFARTDHRPGVIWPYLDSDPALYPHIDRFVEMVHGELGVRSRISTVGIAGNSIAQRSALVRLATMPHALAGLRISVTTYPKSLVAELRTGGSGAAYFDDLAVTLTTLRPAMTTLGVAEHTACCELRFRPLVVSTAVEDTYVDGHHMLRAGPWLLLAAAPGERPMRARVISANGAPIVLDRAATPYLRVRGHRELDPSLLLGRGLGDVAVARVGVYRLVNEDGDYYGAEIVKDDLGDRPLYIYPLTARRDGGYLDGERHFLNALLHHKRTRGIERRAPLDDATWGDVDAVIASLEARRTTLLEGDPAAASYLGREVLVLVRGYTSALRKAGLPARTFFDPNFTRDTGFTCNMGRGHSDYRAIASRANLPVTAQHERSFGAPSTLAAEGVVYRLAPYPTIDGAADGLGTIVVEERDLARTAEELGQLRRRWVGTIDGAVELRGLRIPGDGRTTQ